MRALALAAVVCLPSPALADDGMRCGQWLVSVGDDELTVAQKCGEPTRAATRPVRRCTRYGCFSAVYTVWTYDRGPYEFVRTLWFANHTLVDVSVGDYGH